MKVQLDDEIKTKRITERGARQGDTIPRLLTIAQEDLFRSLNLKKLIKINGRFLNRVKCADDVRLIVSSWEELQSIVNYLHEKPLQRGIKVNLKKRTTHLLLQPIVAHSRT